MDKMALAIGEEIRLDTCFALNDGSDVLLTLSTGQSGALPSPLSVNNIVRLFKLKLLYCRNKSIALCNTCRNL